MDVKLELNLYCILSNFFMFSPQYSLTSYYLWVEDIKED